MAPDEASVARSTYDKFPEIAAVPGTRCFIGFDEIAEALRRRLGGKGVLVIETYPGVDEDWLVASISQQFGGDVPIFRSSEVLLRPVALSEAVDRDLGDDPVFGRMTSLRLIDLLDAERVEALRQAVEEARPDFAVILGTGASIVMPRADLLVYADLSRWEIQLRQRRGEVGNLGLDVDVGTPSGNYKRGFFLDWRVADRQKRAVWDSIDFFLDTHDPRQPKLVEGLAVRRALHHATSRPFRVVPFFDPGPWGGQWMKEVCDLDRSKPNFAWCFDCVPEENSLRLRFDNAMIELPAIDLVFQEPQRLLGEAVHARFGQEFPIRFDFLDTMGGGNLSLQVHPLTEYIQEHFGMQYTQDESYYLLDAASSGCVYLGFREDIDPPRFVDALQRAQQGEGPLDAAAFVNAFPAKKHDHFLIPAGTIHCSGAGAMVLEISATPYIFTFKLWDWNRLGLDGKPRPIHLGHGRKNLQFDRTTTWVKSNLVNQITPIASGDGWREERTGLHEREFIETRRHWFTAATPHDTNGGVNVLNLIEGEEAIVESPTNAFKPFIVHYAETFIVPAAVGRYVIRPHGPSVGRECATIKAFVRTNA